LRLLGVFPAEAVETTRCATRLRANGHRASGHGKVWTIALVKAQECRCHVV
jgi:hypothetical protein